MALARIMSHLFGRGARVVAGILIAAVGLFAVGGVLGWVVAAVGLVPIIAGTSDVCFAAPLLHGPFHGRDARSSAQ